jgi:hypothetical protein
MAGVSVHTASKLERSQPLAGVARRTPATVLTALLTTALDARGPGWNEEPGEQDGSDSADGVG